MPPTKPDAASGLEAHGRSRWMPRFHPLSRMAGRSGRPGGRKRNGRVAHRGSLARARLAADGRTDGRKEGQTDGRDGGTGGMGRMGRTDLRNRLHGEGALGGGGAVAHAGDDGGAGVGLIGVPSHEAHGAERICTGGGGDEGRERTLVRCRARVRRLGPLPKRLSLGAYRLKGSRLSGLGLGRNGLGGDRMRAACGVEAPPGKEPQAGG